MSRLRWEPIIEQAAVWAGSFSTRVTLRQCFYWAVTRELFPNSEYTYKRLSELSTDGREDGTFPELADATRSITRMNSWSNAADFRREVAGWFHLDRTEGQDWQVWIACEKRGLEEQIWALIGERGWGIIPIGGYDSHTNKSEVRDLVLSDGRPAVLIYVGDYDPSGLDIERDFVAKTTCWDEVHRAALTEDQIDRFNLTKLEGKPDDSRSKKFTAKHGELFQVEVDALDPNDLAEEILSVADRYWDEDAWLSVVNREEAIRRSLWTP